MNSRWPFAALLIGCLVAASGCGQGESGAAVFGTVTLKGQPLAGGVVNFFPVKGRPVGSPVASDGTYSATLPPGEYKATVQISVQLPEGWKEGDPVPPPTVQVPLPYTQPQRTPLSLSVPGNERIEHNLAIP